MRGALFGGLLAAIGVAGCALSSPDTGGPSSGARTESLGTPGPRVPLAPGPVTVAGTVQAAAGGALPGVQVARVPTDPYLLAVLSTETAASGAFTLDGIDGESREWLYFDLAGYVGLFKAYDTTSVGLQTLPPVTLLTNAEGAAMAQSLGAVLDPQKSVLIVPIDVTVGGALRPALSNEVELSFQPPLDGPVQIVDGQAIAFNVTVFDSYQVTVTRGGRPCAPAAHPTLVAADGSVALRPEPGTWVVGPPLSCP